MSDDLRDRYESLLRWYPADYRAERGDEIIGTYLELAAPGQLRPRPADVADLVRGGLRQHLRARHALGLLDALPFAGNLALTAATVLAAVWLLLAEPITMPEGYPLHSFGPFTTIGAVAWIAWLLASLAAFAGAGRPAVAFALLMTVLLVPAAPLTSFARPPLFMVIPQIALGVVALAAPSRRWSPSVAAGIVVTAVVAGLVAFKPPVGQYYALLGEHILPAVGLLLAFAAVVSGVVFQSRWDARGWWPALILLGPVLLLSVTLPTPEYPGAWPTWPVAVAASIAAAVVGVAAMFTTLWLRSRRRPAQPCPTSGH